MIFFSHAASDPNRVVFSTRKVVTVPKIDSVELRENSAWPKKTGAYWEQTRRYRPDKTEVKGMLGRGELLVKGMWRRRGIGERFGGRDWRRLKQGRKREQFVMQ